MLFVLAKWCKADIIDSWKSFYVELLQLLLCEHILEKSKDDSELIVSQILLKSTLFIHTVNAAVVKLNKLFLTWVTLAIPLFKALISCTTASFPNKLPLVFPSNIYFLFWTTSSLSESTTLQFILERKSWHCPNWLSPSFTLRVKLGLPPHS